MSDSKNGRRRLTQNHFELTEADRAPFFELARRFSQRVKRQPNLVSDDDIHDLLGAEVDPAKVRSFASKQSGPLSTVPVALDDQTGPSSQAKPAAASGSSATTSEEGKRLRKKTNSALHKRLFALERMIEEVEAAIAGVIAAPGRTNRLSELKQMQQSIDAFRTAIGWPRDPV